MATFKLGKPGTVTHEWDLPWDAAPLTTDVNGHAMRVTLIKIVLDGDGNGIDISVTGMRARADGSRDRRFSYRATEPYDGWITQEAATQFAQARGN